MTATKRSASGRVRRSGCARLHAAEPRGEVGVSVRVLDLFSGIGGLSAAVEDTATVVAAVDHDLRARRVHEANWSSPVHVKNLASVRPDWLASFDADLWWMSPPCTPHGIRGRQADLDDPRSAPFRHLVGMLVDVGPRHLALENVPWFHGSRAWALLEVALERAGYTAVEHAELCPTTLGLPTLRRRLYAVATKGTLVRSEPVPTPFVLKSACRPWREDLALPHDVRARFLDALHVVDEDDDAAIAATFTRAYGRSPVYAGSYLRQDRGDGVRDIRRFAPEEIATLHGMPAGFDFAGLPPAHAWKLVGNGVSAPVVRHVLGWIEGFEVGSKTP